MGATRVTDGTSVAGGFIDLREITTPPNPVTDIGRLYVKNLLGVKTLFFRDSAGNETNLLADVAGEVNTASNVGAGEGLAVAKVGADFPFKSITAGANITLTGSATELEISATAGGAGGDIPDVLYDSTYIDGGNIFITSAGTNTFGAWLEYSPDIGVGKKLIGFVYLAVTGVLATSIEIEIGEGGAGSEVPISRINSVGTPDDNLIHFPLNRTITNNSRVSLRVRDDIGAAKNYVVAILVATA